MDIGVGLRILASARTFCSLVSPSHAHSMNVNLLMMVWMRSRSIYDQFELTSVTGNCAGNQLCYCLT